MVSARLEFATRHRDLLAIDPLGDAFGLVAFANQFTLAHANSSLGEPTLSAATNGLRVYLLILLGPRGFVGQATQALGLGSLSFSFSGLVIGSMLFSLPFAIQPIRNAFVAMGARPMEVAASLGASPLDAFISVALPIAKPGIISATIFCFAHTLGEFGVVLMLGGNIPGKTRVVSTQIYAHVEALEYTQAHWLAAIVLALSFVLLFVMESLQRKTRFSNANKPDGKASGHPYKEVL